MNARCDAGGIVAVSLRASKRTPIIHHVRPHDVANGKAASRISAGDSFKKPVLASADETPSRWGRKFFYCQNPRLRVRAMRLQPAKVSRDDLHHTLPVSRVSDENIFSYSV